MVKVVSKGVFYEDKTEEAINLYKELVQKSGEEKGCISYNLFRDLDNRSILTVIEEWENREALDIHKKTEHFTRLVPEIGKFRKTSELNVYELVL